MAHRVRALTKLDAACSSHAASRRSRRICQLACHSPGREGTQAACCQPSQRFPRVSRPHARAAAPGHWARADGAGQRAGHQTASTQAFAARTGCRPGGRDGEVRSSWAGTCRGSWLRRRRRRLCLRHAGCASQAPWQLAARPTRCRWVPTHKMRARRPSSGAGCRAPRPTRRSSSWSNLALWSQSSGAPSSSARTWSIRHPGVQPHGDDAPASSLTAPLVAAGC